MKMDLAYVVDLVLTTHVLTGNPHRAMAVWRMLTNEEAVAGLDTTP